jgi:hypothetical protein
MTLGVAKVLLESFLQFDILGVDKRMGSGSKAFLY